MANEIQAILTVRKSEETIESAETTIARIKLLLAADPSIDVSGHITVRIEDNE